MPVGDHTRRHLEAGHRADVKRAQQADRRVVEPELRLPQRQQHVEQIGVPVMQHMRATGDRHRAPLRRCDPAQRGRYQRHAAAIPAM
jgi:hypothetical protein